MDDSLDQRLWHYQRAVQCPEAIVTLVERVWLTCFGVAPTRLREDFAGTAAVCAAWVRLSNDHRALAVELDEATAAWAEAQLAIDLGERSEDALVVASDVMGLVGPRVDAVVALNFSIGEWHDRASLVAYLRHARRCLDHEGVVVMDVFGGPGAMEAPRRQRRRVVPGDGEPFEYVWEQLRFNPVTSRIDCAIHFESRDGLELHDAFEYRWRLWQVAELREALVEAGFDDVMVWSGGNTDGGLAPVEVLDGGRDWVVYVVGIKGFMTDLEGVGDALVTDALIDD